MKLRFIFDCMRRVRSTLRQIPYHNTNPWVGDNSVRLSRTNERL
jgi:hypothetical protein